MIERATEDGKNEVVEVAVTCRLDMEEEVNVDEASNVYSILHRCFWKKPTYHRILKKREFFG